MRVLVWIAALAVCAHAEHRLHALGVTTKGWVVGAALLPGGVFIRQSSGEWVNAGYRHPLMTALAWLPGEPETLYVAAGDGVIRIDAAGRWRVLTDETVTELQDISAGPGGIIAFGHTAGFRISEDRGQSWREIAAGLPRRYGKAIRIDRTNPDRIVVGTETGFYVSSDRGRAWRLAGAAGFQAMRVEQSPHEARLWLAVTQKGGVFRSTDGGLTFEATPRDPAAGRNLYDIAFDPTDARRIAVCGWGLGVLVSEDGGLTWEARHRGLPRLDVWSVAFDPDRPGRLYASVHEEALYVSEDAGRTWRVEGLPGSIVLKMAFVPVRGGAR
ncbi:MAG: YCF48-related protein [Bryobacteraceae bacterium]|nr:YCF48-related protein [Bryobacteraceae bacterium]